MDVDNIMIQLDQWVAAHGSGRYISSDTIVTTDTYRVIEDYGIQQVKEEIKQFVEVLIGHGKLNSALEIGLGIFGSTHYLWKQIFNHVSTIELEKSRCLSFRENYRKHTNRQLFNENSYFYFGYSHLPDIVEAVYKNIGEVDLLFIDGGHQYKEILVDWLLYHHLVPAGGVIAFHDIVATNTGVPEFISQLNIDIKRIVCSKDCGIGYYIKEVKKWHK